MHSHTTENKKFLSLYDRFCKILCIYCYLHTYKCKCKFSRSIQTRFLCASLQRTQRQSDEKKKKKRAERCSHSITSKNLFPNISAQIHFV